MGKIHLYVNLKLISAFNLLLYLYISFIFGIKTHDCWSTLLSNKYSYINNSNPNWIKNNVLKYPNYMYITTLNIKVSKSNFLYKPTFVGFNLWFPLKHFNPVTMEFIYHMIICCVSTSVSAWYVCYNENLYKLHK